jgi:hypothetical protein
MPARVATVTSIASEIHCDPGPDVPAIADAISDLPAS